MLQYNAIEKIKSKIKKKNPELGNNPIDTPAVVTPNKKGKTIASVATKATELNALAKTLDTESKALWTMIHIQILFLILILAHYLLK
ncbi:hypothetical protein ACM0K4_02890 [Mycoplasma sp. VS42A]|uniref:hypothetical protein n=1 Tax=Mycoplasma sp. VS42A TaxID=3398774 RepID=UPI003A87A51E